MRTQDQPYPPDDDPDEDDEDRRERDDDEEEDDEEERRNLVGGCLAPPTHVSLKIDLCLTSRSDLPKLSMDFNLIVAKASARLWLTT